MDAAFAMDSEVSRFYRRAQEIYRSQDCLFGPGVLSANPSTQEERNLQLLIYAARFLPSPLYNMDRLMPTNREAQKKYLPFPLDDEEPAPVMLNQPRHEEKVEIQDVETTSVDEMVQEDEKKDKKSTEKSEEEQRSSQEDTQNTHEETEKTKEETVLKIQKTKRIKKRKKKTIVKSSARSRQVHQTSILHYIGISLRMKKNILWTLLLRTTCEPCPTGW
ncbi:uncharacterized protein [Engystomops pustulosus]|uniref:uncharacterized protein isoform X1 n=2 Tax=Engystomops pustulosus TaxID=76066 RepID=UPI003AFA0398